MSEPPSTSKASPAGRRREGLAGPAKQRRLVETAGPDPDAPIASVRLTVGAIVGAFGVRGEAKLRLSTDEPEVLRRITRVWVGDEPQPRRLLGARFHGDQALVRLAGVATPEAVAALRGLPVRIAGADARPLAEGEFFFYQLVGLEAVDEAGTPVGRVTDILETGANDVLVIAPGDGGADLLVPNHPEFVLDTAPNEGRIVVRPIRYD